MPFRRRAHRVARACHRVTPAAADDAGAPVLRPGASFECSDPNLNRLYAADIRTVRLNSHDAFIDCSTREQRAWVGDRVVHQMVQLATNQDWRLAWHYLDPGNSPRSDGILPMSVAGEIEAGGSYTIPDRSLH